jgi:DNA polymerase (family 10)
MAVHNAEIAKIFNQMADLLEIQNANPFRVRAYRNAAMAIYGLSRNVSDLVATDEDLTEIPGIGKDLAGKIKTIVKTGELPQLKAVEKRVPPVLSELMKIESLGPKRIILLHRKLKIRSVKDLQRALEKGKIRKLRGFGKKTEERIKAGIAHLSEYGKRVLLSDAIPIAESLVAYLKKAKGVIAIECAGSYRRKKETVADLDIFATAKKNSPIMDRFINFDEVTQVLSHGSTRSTVRLRSGIQVDLRVVPPKSYGAALVYFTGSKPHNIEIRKIAVKKKLKINEYGVFKGKKYIAGRTEEEVYKQIGLPYIEPELREVRGEIEAAKKGELPKLVTLKDIRGDLHCHTKATDGAHSLEAMVETAAKKGYEYIAITDHSKHLALVHGLTAKDLLHQIKLIDRLNGKSKNIVVLKSIELDILENGSLDLPNCMLNSFQI